ncbi:MAG: flagellar biosynthesis regulator FlaF [Syntrophorhabdus aromaticivorans]|uniref:Flagellar biosynthesis regulator FlaF n=1 Tax=Syntrophorhabdus aromaticivorans TaxID=328301 RepID=A0A351U2Y3_9BACT|nr:flagellar biosynthesis regulator FlaF [Syntrophorhabdus aromaticivorans]HBA54314.1 flagellar biosynthesis regulatory protein FlaF [Syntrophorhabdus aromaticivorans]
MLRSEVSVVNHAKIGSPVQGADRESRIQRLVKVRNPYEVYREAGKQGSATRNLEVTVLVKGARLLRECQKNWNRLDNKDRLSRLNEACTYNQGIWAAFQAEAMKEDNPLPAELKRNILLLSVFIDKRLASVLADPNPEKLAQVIKINLHIAAGLRGSPEGELPFDVE